jgi:C-terminal processing protease CtpA/Prc
MGLRGACASNPIEMNKRLFALGLGVRSSVVTVGLAILGAVSLSATALAAPGTAGSEKVVKKVEVVPESGRPFLGINMQELDASILKGLDPSVKKGVLVTQVVEGSPADKAGIKSGDIVLSFGRKEVGSPAELKDVVADSRVGDTVGVKLVRDGESRTVKVTIGEWPEEESAEVVSPEAFHWFGDDGKGFLSLGLGRGRLGVQVTDLNEGLAPYFGVEAGGGVLVLDVIEGSAAEKMGVKPGDVITKIDGEKTGSAEELVSAVGGLETGEKFDLDLVRAKKDMTLQGEAPDRPADVYVKALRGKKDELSPKIEKFFVRDLPDATESEMKALKKQMEEMQKELQKMRQELDKIKDSA